MLLGTATEGGQESFVIRDESTGKDVKLSKIEGMTPSAMGSGALGLGRFTGSENEVVASDQVFLWAVNPDTKSIAIYYATGDSAGKPIGYIEWPGFSIGEPGVQILDVDQDGHADMVLTATDTSSGDGMIAVWPGDGTKMPWGTNGVVLGLNTTKEKEPVPLAAVLEEPEIQVVTGTGESGATILVTVTDGQAGLDGYYLDNRVEYWFVDDLMDGLKPTAESVPRPAQGWHTLPGGAWTASSGQTAMNTFPATSITINGGNFELYDFVAVSPTAIVTRTMEMGMNGTTVLYLPPSAQTTTVRYDMRVRYENGQTAIGVEGDDGSWTAWDVDLDGVSFSGHDAFAVTADSPIFIAPQGIQQNILHALIATPSGNSTVANMSEALEKIGVPTEGMTIRPIRTDLSDGLDKLILAVVPMGIPEAGSSAYIIEATPLADGWDVPSDDLELKFTLANTYKVSDPCLQATGNGTLCGTTDHFRVTQGVGLPGVMESWTEKAAATGTAMEGLVAVLPWQTGTACGMGLVYIPGITESYAENLKQATLLATSNDSACADLPRPIASGSFLVIDGGNIEFQDSKQVLFESSSGLQVLAAGDQAVFLSPVTALPEGLAFEPGTMLAYGGAVDGNWDDVLDVYVHEIQNNPLYSDSGRDVESPMYKGGHLLLSDGRGGFLMADNAEPMLLDVKGAVGVVGSSPTYGKDKVSKEEAEAIKAQLVEAGATVEVK